MKKMIIIGSGISGILAREYFRKKFDVTVFESSPEKTDPLKFHKAIMRMKTPRAAHILASTVEQIEIRKEIYYNGKTFKESSIQLSNLYSRKTNGGIAKRSIDEIDNATSKRYLVGSNKIDGVNSGHTLSLIDVNGAVFSREKVGLDNLSVHYDVCINTIPLPNILKIACPELHQNQFNYYPINVKIMKVNIPCDRVYQTIYFPGSETWCYRASLENGKIIMESTRLLGNTDETDYILSAFGLSFQQVDFVDDVVQPFGKISEISSSERKSLLLYLTKNFSIYSLGRFAIWKNIKVDDVIDDLEKIDEMINSDEKVNEYKIRLNK